MPAIPKTIDELATAIYEGRVLLSWGVGQTILAVVIGTPGTAGTVEVWRVVP